MSDMERVRCLCCVVVFSVLFLVMLMSDPFDQCPVTFIWLSFGIHSFVGVCMWVFD